MPERPRVDFAKGGGLVPCVAQDALTGRVLMLAWMDEAALERTLATGEMHYHSRSRGRLWKKGEESGHTQELVSLAVDCDGDTLLALVRQAGPACHTGTDTCWVGRELHGKGVEPVLADLWGVIEDRRAHPKAGSWTNKLLAEPGLVEAKVREEADEVVARAGGEGEDTLAHEIADLVYHALVLGAKHGTTLDDVLAELTGRRG